MRRRFLLLPLVVVTVVILGCGESVPVPPADFWITATPEEVASKFREGLDVNARGATPPGWTPLHYAANYSEDPEVVSVLLEAGAEVDALGKTGSLMPGRRWFRTPLHLAVEEPASTEIVKLLIAAGADVNAISGSSGSGVTMFGLAGSAPLIHAVRNPNPELVSILIEAGADVHMPFGGPLFKLANRFWGWVSVDSSTPLQWAIGSYLGPKAYDNVALFDRSGS